MLSNALVIQPLKPHLYLVDYNRNHNLVYYTVTNITKWNYWSTQSRKHKIPPFFAALGHFVNQWKTVHPSTIHNKPRTVVLSELAVQVLPEPFPEYDETLNCYRYTETISFGSRF